MKKNPDTNTQELSIQHLLDSGLSFALYRLPHAEEVSLVLQETGHARPIGTNEREPRGFILAPFAESNRRPILLIKPEVVVQGWEPIMKATRQLPHKELHLDRALPKNASSNYEQAFTKAQARIKNGMYEKVVLADKYWAPEATGLLGREAQLFLKAIKGFPNSMVSLVYTPTSGRWIGITPEILLERNDKQMRTMALAGTKICEEEPWDLKNKQEHQTVSNYLADIFNQLGIPYSHQGPYTRKAGSLFHLCTDYLLPCCPTHSTMELLRRLHPTPAICGFPKAEVLAFLRYHERAERKYYSGYLGPINLAGGTRLYVNLRCALIGTRHTVYYAGGGVNHLSEYTKERQEIEHKMNTLRELAHD